MTRSAPPTSFNRSSRTRAVSLPVAGTALLLIDVINDFAFPGSGMLVAQAEPMALRLAVLQRPPPPRACRRSTSTTTSANRGRISADGRGEAVAQGAA